MQINLEVLNLSALIAKKVAFSNRKSFSGFITRLSIIATMLSVATMIIAFAILYGFQDAVSSKVFGFWGHIRIKSYEEAKSSIAEDNYIEKNKGLELIVQNNKNVKSISPYAIKSAILSSRTEFDGLLMKGVERNFDTTSFKKFLIEGRFIQYNDSSFSKEIVVSKYVAELLKVKLNDKLLVHCFDNTTEKTRTKNVTIAGIFKTDIDEYDKQFFLCDLDLIRDLNYWDTAQIGGYEIMLKDIGSLDKTNEELHAAIPEEWQSNTIKKEYPYIFDWLKLLDKNKYIFLVVVGIVAIVNLITCLIILVLERIKMIGILKALGYANSKVRSIFVYQTSFITIIGILLGAALGVGLSVIQKQTGLLKLSNTETYSLTTVPILIEWWHLPVICGGTLAIAALILTIPAFIINKMQPVQAIRFD